VVRLFLVPDKNYVALAQIGVARRHDDFKLRFLGAVEFRDKRSQRRLKHRCAIVRSGSRPVAQVDDHPVGLFRVGK
jgi:hypothetical protein